jgi:hypothetical protein
MSSQYFVAHEPTADGVSLHPAISAPAVTIAELTPKVETE